MTSEELLDYMRSDLGLEDKVYLRHERNEDMSTLSIEAIKSDIWTALSPYGRIINISIEYRVPPKTNIEFIYAYKDTWNIVKNISDALSAIPYIEDAFLTFDAYQINAINIKFDINMSTFDKERKNNMPPKENHSGYFLTAFFNGPSIRIDHVMFNGPATIVYWSDDTKTIVKCMEGEEFDPEKGLAMAICKRLYGNDFHRVFKNALRNAETRKGDEAKRARKLRVTRAKIKSVK